MPVATSFTRGSEHSRPCSVASKAAAAAPQQHAGPGRTGEVSAAKAGHGRQHQHALQPQVDAAGLFGQALTQADEQEGRAHPQAPPSMPASSTSKIERHEILSPIDALGGPGHRRGVRRLGIGQQVVQSPRRAHWPG
jgi:hypothetical protein